MMSNIPKAFDSFQNMVYNFNDKGQQLVPRTSSGFPVFPCDTNRVPLFPANITTREAEFLYNEDGILVLPVNEQDRVILPLDLFGEVKFPLDEMGSLIWPIDEEGMPYPPLNIQGIPSVRYDQNGLPILPYDESGKQLIMFDEHGIPMKLSEFNKKFSMEQAKSWGGGKLPPRLVMPVAPIVKYPTTSSQKTIVSPSEPLNPLPFLPPTIPNLDLPEIPPEYNLAMAKLAARNLTGKFQLEYTIEIKHWEEEMEKRRQEMMKQYLEEREKLEKARREEEERKRRLGNFLKANVSKEPALVEKNNVKKTAEQLRLEALAKRERLREEERRKRTEAEQEVQKYYDEVTKEEIEKQKNKSELSSPSSADTYQEMDAQRPDHRQSLSPKRKHDEPRNQRIYVAGERKRLNSSSIRQDDHRDLKEKSRSMSIDQKSENTARKHKHKRRRSSRSSERSERSHSREKSRKRKKAKKSKKHKREKKRKREKERSNTPPASSPKRPLSIQDIPIQDHLSDKKDTQAVDKTANGETVAISQREELNDQKELNKIEESITADEMVQEDSQIPEELKDKEETSKHDSEKRTEVSKEIQPILDEEEEVRQRLLAKQQERVAARRAAEAAKIEHSNSIFESPVVAIRPIQMEIQQRENNERVQPSLNVETMRAMPDDRQSVDGTLNSFKQVAENYLREMESYLMEIRRERELLSKERKKCQKMLASARILVEHENSSSEEAFEDRPGRRKVLQVDHRGQEPTTSSSKIYINPAVLKRKNSERASYLPLSLPRY